MQQIKSFLWFGAKVAVALVAIRVVNNLVAKFTGFDALGMLDDLGNKVA